MIELAMAGKPAGHSQFYYLYRRARGNSFHKTSKFFVLFCRARKGKDTLTDFEVL